MTLKKFSAALYLFLFIAGCAPQQEPIDKEPLELKALLDARQAGEIVRAVYADREFRPVWTRHGQKLPIIQQFFDVLNDRSHGIHPLPPELDLSDSLQFDIDVTTALISYARDVARKDADVKAELLNAIRSGTVAQLADRLAPIHSDYARLRAALAAATDAEREQIELNMNRWRKVPDNLGARHIRVNIPSFELEAHDGAQIPLRMKVIVGANATRTPIFSSEMKTVVFSPYWNIPESILTKETLPKIKADPAYATRQRYEVVRVSRRGVEVVDPEDVDWDRVGSDIQLRQRPGSGNSLGLVKFLFPNKYDVYLHDTPSDSLFNKASRNLSHGCIRLEKPQELAEWVLRDRTDWPAERIRTAMHSGSEKHVALEQSIPVYIFYFTAWVDDAGALHLEKDVYGYDVDNS